MIYKKRYGQPFDTESVVGSFLPMMETIPYLTKEPDGFSYAMEPQDVLYGLGENVRGINKRGWVYESKCSDDGNHTEGKSSLYGAYNFMIVSGKDTFGVFIDYPGKVTFDCGYTDMDTLRITVAEENYDFYIIEGESLTDIVHQFRQLVGRSSRWWQITVPIICRWTLWFWILITWSVTRTLRWMRSVSRILQTLQPR